MGDGVWQFERSSGYAGYRNSVTGEWRYASEMPKPDPVTVAASLADIEAGRCISLKDYIGGLRSADIPFDETEYDE